MKKRMISFLCGAVMMFSSCAADRSAKNDTPEIAPAPDFYPITEIKEGRKNIYFILKILEGSSYWDVIINGAKASGDLYDCNIYLSGSNVETDWQGQQRLLDDAEKAGADAVVLAPDDSVKLSEKIAEVHERGTPVILIDTIANTEEYDVCYMTDNLIAGQYAAKEMIAQLTAMGKQPNEYLQVGIQVGATTSLTISERLAGFLQYWTDNAPSDWEVINDIKCNDGDVEKAKKCAAELMDGYPDLCGVFGPNNGSSVGFASTVRERSRTDIAVIGFDYCDDLAALIDDSSYTASSILQRQYYMSIYATESALKIINGESPEKKFVDTGVIVINPETINTPEAQEALKNS